MQTLRVGRTKVIVAWCLLTLFLKLSHCTHGAEKLHLAVGGQAHMSVIVASNASSRVVVAANELADMLGRMTGGVFPLETGEGTNGIAVGMIGDFPLIASGIVPAPDDPLMRERYRLYTHATGAWVIGASESAVEHAVWDFLARLGYRLYFMTDNWEIVPELPDAEIELDVLEAPDYHTRQAPRGAPWSNTDLWNRWRKRNRITPAFGLSTGHAYSSIIRANAAAFDAHPEYLALVKGERQGSKFCLSNPGLRALVVDYAVRVMQDNPTRDSISMEPSDGGGWCECEACAAMGSISDRVLTLANDVAEAINQLGLGPRYVGFYAYNEHSPPPSIFGNSNVIVSTATSFIRGGYTIEDLVEGWQSSGVTLGIRDYHDVFTWSHDLPRRARGGNLNYLQRTIPYFFQHDARFMNSENGDSWGANGLGYWLTPQMLWNVENANNLDALIQDFVDHCFGAAAPVMAEFYHFLSWDRTLQTDENVIARLYNWLHAAYQLTSDNSARARLDDLVLYTRYLELYHNYRRASGEERQAGFEAVLRHAYRMRDRYMLSTVAICHRERFRDSSVTVPPEAEWGVAEPDNPWKDSTPYTELEIADYIAQGRMAFTEDIPDFEPISFSSHLVSCAPLNPPSLAAGSATLDDRGYRRYHIWLDQPRSFNLEVRGGMITHYQDRGNVRVSLSVWRDNRFDLVCNDDSVPPDNTMHTISLTSPYAGLHCLEISDGSDKTRIVQPTGIPITYYAPLDDPEVVPGTWTLYGYVPPRTTVVGGFASSTAGRLVDAEGHLMFDFTQMERPGYFSVVVPEGRDGTFWRFEGCTGHRILMTIPPCLARTPAELLLPREVVYWEPPEPAFSAMETFTATEVTHQSARLTGSLAVTGSAPAQVTLHWGDLVRERGTIELGTVTPGVFSSEITDLEPGTAYYFRAFTWHQFGSDWSAPLWFVTDNMLPFREDFESLSPGALHLHNGWQSEPVEAAEVLLAGASGSGGTRAASLNDGRLSQSFGEACAATNIVWTDMLLCPSRSSFTSPEDVPVLKSLPEDQTGTAIFYVDYVTGIVVVYDGRLPSPLLHIPRLAIGTWTRFSIRSDYLSRTWGLWLNGQKVADNLAFANTSQSQFAALSFEEPAFVSTPTLIDKLLIDLDWSGRPPGITIVDEDGDGICDDWERAFFGSLNIAAGKESDADGDGFCDLDEFLAGTNPLDPDSLLKISKFEQDGEGALRLEWPSVQDRSYMLEFCPNLKAEAWSPRMLLHATPPTNQCQLPLLPEEPGFFRLRLDAWP